MKKGFTLVELLAVLIILGLLGLIIMPVIDNVLNVNKETLYEVQIKNIIASTKNWASENRDKLPEGSEFVYVSLNSLNEKGYIDVIPLDPKTNTNMTGCVKIGYNEINDNYSYEYVKDCGQS